MVAHYKWPAICARMRILPGILTSRVDSKMATLMERNANSFQSLIIHLPAGNQMWQWNTPSFKDDFFHWNLHLFSVFSVFSTATFDYRRVNWGVQHVWTNPCLNPTPKKWPCRHLVVILSSWFAAKPRSLKVLAWDAGRKLGPLGQDRARFMTWSRMANPHVEYM